MTEARVVRVLRDLRPNHMLGAGDVIDSGVTGPVQSPFVTGAESLYGSYLRVAKAAGDTLAPDDVCGAPALPTGATLMSLPLTSAQALGGRLTVDMRVDVYGIAKLAGATAAPDRLARDLRVVAVLKNPGSTEGSVIAILELPRAAEVGSLQEAALKLTGASDLCLVVRS